MQVRQALSPNASAEAPLYVGLVVSAWNTGQMPGPPEPDVARVRSWCEQLVHDQVRVECEVGPHSVTLVERRRPEQQDTGAEWTRFPIARLRYTQTTRTWALYWRDRDERFHLYHQLAPSPDIDDLLGEIDRDPTALFWG